LAALPLAVVTVLVCSQALGGSFSSGSQSHRDWSLTTIAQWGILSSMIWFCLILVKIMLGIQLVIYATRRRKGMALREEIDAINDFGRHPIGETTEERARTAQIKELLDRPGLHVPSGRGDAKADSSGKKRYKLEEVTRFTMTKRIW